MTDFFITLCGSFVGCIFGMWIVGWYVSGWDKDDA